MKSLRASRKLTLFSTIVFFSVAIVTAQNPAPCNTWDSILAYMLSLMGVLGLLMVIVQIVTGLRSSQIAQREEATKPDDS